MKLFIITVFTFFFISSVFADTSPRITSTLSLGQIDKIQSSYGADHNNPSAILAMEGDTLLIADPTYNNNTGIVYVYIYNKTTALYDKVSNITASNGGIGDKFGLGLAFKDGLIAIGAPYADHGGDNRGLLYLLTKPDTGWADIACDNYWGSPSENNNDFFGKAIALDSHTMIVSAPGDHGYRGAAYVYEKDNRSFIYKATLTGSEEYGFEINNEDDSPMFGASIAIDNDTIVIGCPNTYHDLPYVGGAYVYVKPASGWSTTTENALLYPTTYSGVSKFGLGSSSIAIEGNTIILAASRYGHGLYIYEKPSTGWGREQFITETIQIGVDEDTIDSVVLSNNTIIAGVARHYSQEKSIAFIYKKISGKWKKYKTISPYTQPSTDYYSRTIIKNGKNIVISANNSTDGIVYVFGDILTENTIENKKNIMTITDNDDEHDPSYHYSVLPGEDANFFTFGNGYGNLKFNDIPDFENPLSSNGNNIYTARIKFSEPGGTIKAYHIAIRVSDVVDESEPKKAMSFNELNKLKASNPDNNSKFGYSVAIDGNTAVVGAYDEGGYNIGLAYVYEKNTITNKFEQKATLFSTYQSINEHLGISVAIHGDFIVIGADRYLYKVNDDNYIETGAALVYEKPENGWENADESYTLYAYDKAPNDHFGKSVAINDDVIVVGSPKDDDNGENTGSVYIFDIKNHSSYHIPFLAKLTSWLNTGDEQFGESIAVDEDTIIVGAPYTDSNYDVDIGMVYLYKKPLLGWSSTDQYSAYLDPDAHAGDMFGYSVAIANDVIAASSVHDDNGNGSVYLFNKPIYSWNNYWLAVPNTAKLIASDAHPAALFGSSIAMNSHTIVIGSQNADETNGAVYLFDKPTSGWGNAHENKKLINTNREEENFFGCSVAMSDKTIIAGSYGEDHAQGSAIIFYTDNDEDGITNDIDPDDDNDGVLDINDAFPNNPLESIDTDHDGIGNNADLDDDNDGIEDTLEIANGLDPLDPSDAQTDLDNDGFSNTIEIIAGSDIHDASSKPIWTPIMMGDILIFVPYFTIH